MQVANQCPALINSGAQELEQLVSYLQTRGTTCRTCVNERFDVLDCATFVMSLRLACVNATWSHHTACGVRDTRQCTSTIPFVPTAATQREHASGGAPRGQRCVWREGPATPPRAPPAAVAPPAYQNHVVAMLNWAMQQCSKTWRFTQDIARKNMNSCRIKELTKQAQTRHASLMKG
jgi:hypothetical protein